MAGILKKPNLPLAGTIKTAKKVTGQYGAQVMITGKFDGYQEEVYYASEIVGDRLAQAGFLKDVGGDTYQVCSNGKFVLGKNPKGHWTVDVAQAGGPPSIKEAEEYRHPATQPPKGACVTLSQDHLIDRAITTLEFCVDQGIRIASEKFGDKATNEDKRTLGTTLWIHMDKAGLYIDPSMTEVQKQTLADLKTKIVAEGGTEEDFYGWAREGACCQELSGLTQRQAAKAIGLVMQRHSEIEGLPQKKASKEDVPF